MAGPEPPARSIPEYYPEFKPAGGFLSAPTSWTGTIRPFAGCNRDEALALVADLEADAIVMVHDGRLRHDPACRREHRPGLDGRLLESAPKEAFRIRLVVWPPPVHPKIIALAPDISSTTFPTHPHLFRPEPLVHVPELPNLLPDALCTYRPGDGEWSWQTGDLVLFLDYAAIYLAKHLVWMVTGACKSGRWIGQQASHAAQDLVAELDPNGECRCGSGARYQACHLATDRVRARQLRVA